MKTKVVYSGRSTSYPRNDGDEYGTSQMIFGLDGRKSTC